MRLDTSSLLLCAALCLRASALVGSDVEPLHNRRPEARFAKPNGTVSTSQPPQQPPDSQSAEPPTLSSSEDPVPEDPSLLTTSSTTITTTAPVEMDPSTSLEPQTSTAILEHASLSIQSSSQILPPPSPPPSPTPPQPPQPPLPLSSSEQETLSSTESALSDPSYSSPSSRSMPSSSSSPSPPTLIMPPLPDSTSAGSISSSYFSTLRHNNSTTLQSQTRSLSSTSKSKPQSVHGPEPLSTGRSKTKGKPTNTSSAPNHLPSGYAVTTITCGTSSNNSECVRPGPVTITTRTCTPVPKGKVYTVFSVVHTSTVTVKDNATNYTMPYAPLVTPDYCSFVVPKIAAPADANRTAFPSPVVYSSNGQEYTTTSYENAFGLPSLPSVLIGHTVTATAIITDKNPAVVTTPDPVPTRTSTDWPGGVVDHKPPTNDPPTNDPPQGVNLGPFTITAGTKTVIINQHTYTDIGPGQTRTVTVDNGAVFTIGPSGVVGQGATVSRPTPDGQPTPTNVGGIPVTVQPSSIVIGGGTFAIPTAATTATVNGNPVVIGPDSVSINGETYSFSRPGKSNFVIAGGELMTAIGQSVVVLHSTTYTYGPGSPAVKSVVNDDTVLIGPTDVSVHGTTVGGPAAEPSETDYEIVGAATIEKLPPSMFVINSKTYAVGPGAGTSTVVIGDQTITLSPNGLVVASRTMSYPFNAQVVTTITGSTSETPMPEVTGSNNGDDGDGDDNNDDEEDAAFSVRPDRRVGIVCLCIAIGAWVLG